MSTVPLTKRGAALLRDELLRLKSVERPAVVNSIAEARAHGLGEILALTRQPEFFVKLGFAPAEREHFPLKVWADCVRCPRNNCCDEVAVVLKL